MTHSYLAVGIEKSTLILASAASFTIWDKLTTNAAASSKSSCAKIFSLLSLMSRRASSTFVP